MTPIFFHIDVNSAFLSWSAIDHLRQNLLLDLRSIPSIIGGDIAKRHGVVLAKSIPAKKFQITTGEPIVSALRKCPSLFIEPPNHKLYEDYSHSFINLLRSVCPDIEQLSIDECFMYFSPISYQFTSPLEGATMIRKLIEKELGFTVNIGVSNKKVLAKMASDFKKPNLVHTLFDYEIQSKLWNLPLSSLYMCGHSSVEILKKLEITTIGQLAQADLNILKSHLKNHGKLLWQYANGIDNSMINLQSHSAKGIGNSTTLPKNATKKEEAFTILLLLSESVAQRLRNDGSLTTMISVEIKYDDFKTTSHQTTLSTPTNITDIIYKTSCSLFTSKWNGYPVRLLGIRTSKLISIHQPQQLSLFDLPSAKSNDLDKAIDSIRNRFGDSAIVRGSLLK